MTDRKKRTYITLSYGRGPLRGNLRLLELSLQTLLVDSEWPTIGSKCARPEKHESISNFLIISTFTISFKFFLLAVICLNVAISAL